MLLSAALAETPAIHTCNSRSLQEVSKVDPVTEVYAVVQTLVIEEVCAFHKLVAD